MFVADARLQQQQQQHHRVPLLDSVQESLDRICNYKNQPQPDDDVKRRLALMTEENALHVLDQIYNSKAPIRTLNGFIYYMIRKVENESPSPSTTVRTSCSSPQSVPARLNLSPQSQGWILRTVFYFLSQFESWLLSVVVRVAVVEQSGENGLYSSASPVHTSQFQSPSTSSVTPQRLYLSSQGQTSFDYFLDFMLFRGDLMKPVLLMRVRALLQVRQSVVVVVLLFIVINGVLWSSWTHFCLNLSVHCCRWESKPIPGFLLFTVKSCPHFSLSNPVCSFQYL